MKNWKECWVWCSVLMLMLSTFIIALYCAETFKHSGQVDTHQWVISLTLLALNALNLHLNLQELKR